MDRYLVDQGDIMETLYSSFFLVGIILIAIANFGHRSSSAPAIGAGSFVLPWRSRNRYTALGYKLHLTGYSLWGISAVLAALLLAK